VKVTETLYGENVVIINFSDAEKLEFEEGDKVVIINPEDRYRITASLMITRDLVDEGYILIPSKLAELTKIRHGGNAKLILAPYPESINAIKKKIKGEKLSYSEILNVIKDIVSFEIGKPEIIAFTLAEEFSGMTIEEIEYLCKAMYETGEKIHFEMPTYDKHSIGGVPGNKVSLLIVPIVASTGLIIPKTSSRAITSPSGTADTMEVLANVMFSAEEFKEIVNKVGGAIIWGGGLNLAPADDIIIRAERLIGIDPVPQMIASILSKKMAAGIKNKVLDKPTAKETKIESIKDAEKFAHLVIELGRKLNINIQAAITYGEQPVGHTVGPALEALEALETLQGDGPSSLIEKACSLSGILLEMGGVAQLGAGYEKAKDILASGKAYSKMKEIIETQGGNPDIKPSDIPLGEHRYKIYSPIDGYVTRISNKAINIIARAAGAPQDKGAGIKLYAKRGYKVRKGDILMEIYAERSTKLQDAISISRHLNLIVVEGMLLKTIPERPVYRYGP
jgi:AMP phosphorylase